MRFEDSSLMPIGKHKGEKMANVPAKYLLWMHEEIAKKSKSKWSLNEKLIQGYIDYNMDVLQKEIKQNGGR